MVEEAVPKVSLGRHTALGMCSKGGGSVVMQLEQLLTTRTLLVVSS